MRSGPCVHVLTSAPFPSPQVRDEKKQAELSKQLSMNRAHNEAAVGALRQRLTHCEQDLDALYADPTGVRESARELLTTADQTIPTLQALLSQLDERRRQVEAAEVVHHAQAHHLAAKALAQLCEGMREVLEARATPCTNASARGQQLEHQVLAWHRLARAKALEAGVEPGPEAVVPTQIRVPAHGPAPAPAQLPKQQAPAPPAATPRGRPPPRDPVDYKEVPVPSASKPKGAHGKGASRGAAAAATSAAAAAAATSAAAAAATSAATAAHPPEWTEPEWTAPEATSPEATALEATVPEATALVAPYAPSRDLAGIVLEVVLEKPDKNARLGVTLSGEGHPFLDAVASDALAHGKLFVGDQVLSVSGWNAVGHMETTKRLKRMYGVIRLRVLRRVAGHAERVMQTASPSASRASAVFHL